MKNQVLECYKWEFRPRFRKRAFGWKSQPAIARIKQAVSEIKRVAKTDARLAAEGAVKFLEILPPAIEIVDSSSGALGTAVNKAIIELVKQIVKAEVDEKTREDWLDRLFEAVQEDKMPYIELLYEYWGDLCKSQKIASKWADNLISITSMALGSDKNLRGHFPGASACLSALYKAERYEELIALLFYETHACYKFWEVKALAAMGRIDDAIACAESCRSSWTPESATSALCEEILLSVGRIDEAYLHYSFSANECGTYIAKFRSIVKKYPHKSSEQILKDLISKTPGEEGKWFAAAKEAGLFKEAMEIAKLSPCDPKTLTRAARDYACKEPEFAINSGVLALYWISRGYGYEISYSDVSDAYCITMETAEKHGTGDLVREKIKQFAINETSDGFLRLLLSHKNR